MTEKPTPGGVTMIERILALAEAERENLAAWRREFHAYPELSFRETETTARIHRILEESGYSRMRVGTAGVPTGLVADLGDGRPGPCIALRADIDALPMKEEGTPPWRSRNEGVMHACGHDAHTAILLGAAKILKALETEIPGRVRFIFQPSEESPRNSGARAMIREGVLEGVDAIAGLHVWGTIPAGEAGFHAGPFMAASDEWEVTILGKGGHGAVPHLATDPIVAAGALIGALQAIVSRESDPLEAVVVTCGHMEAGTTFNIIPDRAFLQGTVRTFNPDVRAGIPGRMERICRGICEALGCRVDFRFSDVLPATVNDRAFTENAAAVARRVLGKDRVAEIRPTMGAEDMSLYLEKVPGTFLFLGTKNEEKGIGQPQHHPEFDVDDDILPRGSALLAALAWDFLEKNTVS
jgi:amidohydrolase